MQLAPIDELNIALHDTSSLETTVLYDFTSYAKGARRAEASSGKEVPSSAESKFVDFLFEQCVHDEPTLDRSELKIELGIE